MLVLALSVAMDAVAVAISAGMARRASWGESLRLGAVFGLFQALMPALGYAGGLLFRGRIEEYDHWVAFVLLAAVGAHMIHESRGAPQRPRGNPFSLRRLMILGVATSIDALVVGLSLAILEVSPVLSIAIIGATTFLLCVPAARMGARLGERLAHRAEFVGGVVLIAIGVRILIEHLSGAA